MLPVLMEQCRDTKRRETRLRCTTAFLLIHFFSTVLFLQVSGCDIKEVAVPLKQANQDVNQTQRSRHFKPFVHLLSAKEESQNRKETFQNEGIFIKWMIQQNSRKFMLECNNTTVVVPREGTYFFNLRINYIAHGCTQDSLELWAAVMLFDYSYPEWRPVVSGTETMNCKNEWKKSLTISRVERFEKATRLRVKIVPENFDFITWNTDMYFDVTQL